MLPGPRPAVPSSPARRPRILRTAARVVPLALVAAGLSALAGPAAAVDPSFRCDGGAVYVVQADGQIDRAQATTGVVTATPVVAARSGDAAPGVAALGITWAGTAAEVVGSDLVQHGAGAPDGTTSTASAESVGGAVDPVGGLFWEGSYRGSRLVLRGYDLKTHAPSGSTVRVTVPSAPGHEGDVAFDAAGHVYVVASSTRRVAYYVGSMPGSGSGSVTASKVRTSKVPAAVTGLAFASDGYLYASTARTLQRLDPVTGVLGVAKTFGADVRATDLGSCAAPSTLSVRTDLPDGRVHRRDQFTASVRSAQVDGLPRALRPTGTTSGSDRGLQDQPAETAGPVAVLPGSSYTIASRAAGTTDGRRYASSWSCVDPGGRVVAHSAAGGGRSGLLTVPDDAAGKALVCTVTQAAPTPRLAVTQTVTPTTSDHVGQTRTFAATVTNTGNVALERLTVADSHPGLTPRTCAPTPVGASLLAGASTTCRATAAVTQGDLDAAVPTTDRVSVSATTARGLGAARTTASTETRLVAAASPALTVSATTAPATVARVGQPITYAVTVTNSGNQTLRDVVATAVAPDLHALGCTPVAQGGSLPVGQKTVCSATRTSVQGDLRAGGTTVSVSAGALGPDGRGVVATATTRTGVASAPPKAVDDQVAVAHSTPLVTVATRPNDSPGAPDGPAIDVSRTVLLQPGADESKPGYKSTYGSYGTFSVLPDGSVRYLAYTQAFQLGPVYEYTESVRYRTFDVAGQSAVATLRITFRAAAVARPDTVTGLQGDQLVALHPLANDSPGGKLDGTRATFDPGSLRFTDDQPEGTGVVSLTGDALSAPYVGSFTIAAGAITFDPSPLLARPVTVSYAVTDSAGYTARSTVTFTVKPVVPTATDDAVTTIFGPFGGGCCGEPITLAGPTNDQPGATGRAVVFGGFVGRDGAPGGSSLVTAQGRWTGPALGTSGRITFESANGFSGVATARYAAQTERGGTATGNLKVTVRPGPSTRPAVVATPRGVAVTVDPTRYATASQHVDGSPGHFVVRRTTFDLSGQPAGATLSADGTSLVLPGRGTARVAAGTGLITFTPQPGFSGFVGRIRVSLENDDSGFDNSVGTHVVGVLTLLVTGDAPVATDDQASTVLGQPVTLPGATDDDPGTATTTGLTTVFPSTGQPGGSVVSGGGKKLTDPVEGVWVINADGTVTFTPAPGFVDATAPVVYRIQGAGGRTDTADLEVTVAPGATAVRDVVTRPQVAYFLQVDPLANDRPGQNADGTPGTLDPTTVRFPSDGQPPGTQIYDAGQVEDVPVPGSSTKVRFSADLTSGLVGVFPPEGFRGTLPTVRYSVASRTTGSTGVVRVQTVSAALQVQLVGRDPVATDDTVTVAAGQTAVLPGPSNDIPASADAAIDTYGAIFPLDQVADLPSGSKVDFHGEQNEGWWEATVPGEGYWRIYWSDTFVTFRPEPTFRGTTTPVRYEIRDSAGSRAQGLLSVTVLPPAVRRDDLSSTRQGIGVTVDVFANDTPAPVSAGVPTPAVVGASFSPEDQPKGAVLTAGDLTVPKEGTFRVQAGTGRVTFRPLSSFHGTTSPVTVTIDDQQSRLRVDVAPVVPSASPDVATSTAGAGVRVAVLDDDDPGTPTRPLVPSSVRVSAAGLTSGSAVVSGDGRLLTVAGRGVFAVAGDGTVAFYPLAGSTGTLPAVHYDVADVNGTRAASTVTVRVRS